MQADQATGLSGGIFWGAWSLHFTYLLWGGGRDPEVLVQALPFGFLCC